MNLFQRGRLAVIAACLLAAAPFTASAQSALLSFVSEPGDYVGAGQTLSFSGSEIWRAAAADDLHSLGLGVRNASHDFSLELAAAPGQPLAPGMYVDSETYPETNGPHLYFSGDGRGCNVATGNFQILELRVGRNGYIERLHATWEQHCEDNKPALFGEVDISNPPLPDPMTVTMTFDPRVGFEHRSSDVVVVRGTLSCSREAVGNAQGAVQVRQDFEGKRRYAYGWAPIDMPCGPTPRAWSFAIPSAGSNKFKAGTVILTLGAYATDPNNGMPVRTDLEEKAEAVAK